MVAILLVAPAMATIFSTVRGIVHDPSHRPVAGARVTVRAQNSEYSQAIQTSSDGSFEFPSVRQASTPFMSRSADLRTESSGWCWFRALPQ